MRTLVFFQKYERFVFEIFGFNYRYFTDSLLLVLVFGMVYLSDRTIN